MQNYTHKIFTIGNSRIYSICADPHILHHDNWNCLSICYSDSSLISIILYFWYFNGYDLGIGISCAKFHNIAILDHLLSNIREPDLLFIIWYQVIVDIKANDNATMGYTNAAVCLCYCSSLCTIFYSWIHGPNTEGTTAW